MNCDRILLIGPRGAGKSTVGALVAARLGLPFIDSDRRIEAESGRAIAEMLLDGSFRRREAALMATLLRGPPSVVAAGGGAVLWEGIEEGARGWWTVWLDAEAGVLARRIAGDPSARPSLTGRPAPEEIAQIAAERAPRYARVASCRVDTTALAPEEVVEILVREVRNASRPRRANSD